MWCIRQYPSQPQTVASALCPARYFRAILNILHGGGRLSKVCIADGSARLVVLSTAPFDIHRQIQELIGFQLIEHKNFHLAGELCA